MTGIGKNNQILISRKEKGLPDDPKRVTQLDQISLLESLGFHQSEIKWTLRVWRRALNLGMAGPQLARLDDQKVFRNFPIAFLNEC